MNTPREFFCRKCGMPITGERLGSDAIGYKHMPGECVNPPPYGDAAAPWWLAAWLIFTGVGAVVTIVWWATRH